ncbi:MAG: hypothetical protein WEF50_05825 [Myxococcota bacterium]
MAALSATTPSSAKRSRSSARRKRFSRERRVTSSARRTSAISSSFSNGFCT